jgi:conjugal transfer/entry exclusion protein
MLIATLAYPSSAFTEAELSGTAAEFTRLLNNGELVSLAGQSGEQITNQVMQISQLAKQIENKAEQRRSTSLDQR